MDKPELRDAASTVQYIQSQIRFLRAEKLADAKAGKPELLINTISDDQTTTTLIKNMESMIAALGGNTARQP